MIAIRNNLSLINKLSKPVLFNKAASNYTVQKMSLLTISSSIIDGLKKSEIIPEVIDNFEPKGLLTISYGKDKEVAMGNTLKVDETQQLPKFQFTNNSNLKFNNNDKFTIVLTDPDAPSKTDKKWSEFCHYIKSELSFNAKDLQQGDDFFSSELDVVNDGKELIPYMGPGPPKGTGKHRYVFLFYKQSGSGLTTPSDRPNWGTGIPANGVKQWAEQNKLQLLAINYFYAENK